MRERRAVACVDGPLAGYAPGFRGWLTERGYRPSSVEGQAFLMGQLSRWLADEGLQPLAFSGEVVEEFPKARRETHSHLSGAWFGSAGFVAAVTRAKLQRCVGCGGGSCPEQAWPMPIWTRRRSP